MKWILESILGSRTSEAIGRLSLEERMSRLSDALRERFAERGANGEIGYGVYPVQTFDDSVIYRANGKVWSIDYTFAAEDGAVALGAAAVEVVQRYVPIRREALLVDSRAGDVFRVEGELMGPALRAFQEGEIAGQVWDVVLIREGLSKNRNHYGRKALAEAAALYENRPMFLGHTTEQTAFGRSNAEKEVVGFTRGVRGVILSDDPKEGQRVGASAFGLAARASVVDQTFNSKLAAAHEHGNPALFGLSHDVRAESVTSQATDGPFYEITSIRKVESVDWVLNPSAGGRVLRQVASDTPHPQLQEDARVLRRSIEVLRNAGVHVPDGCNESTVLQLLVEAIGGRAPGRDWSHMRAAARTLREAIEAGDRTTASIIELEDRLVEATKTEALGFPSLFFSPVRAARPHGLALVSFCDSVATHIDSTERRATIERELACRPTPRNREEQDQQAAEAWDRRWNRR